MGIRHANANEGTQSNDLWMLHTLKVTLHKTYAKGLQTDRIVPHITITSRSTFISETTTLKRKAEILEITQLLIV